jgi:hypothetical protein
MLAMTLTAQVRVLEEVPGESGSTRLVRASNELGWSIVGGIVFGLGRWLTFPKYSVDGNGIRARLHAIKRSCSTKSC